MDLGEGEFGPVDLIILIRLKKVEPDQTVVRVSVSQDNWSNKPWKQSLIGHPIQRGPGLHLTAGRRRASPLS